MLDASNCITINAPMGAKAHQLGRLIASCDNVLWYNYKGNGTNPWEFYNEKDAGFTKFHFNRRFAGATGHGVCSKTIIPIGSKNDAPINEQCSIINMWCETISPKNFVYPLHEPVKLTRKIFLNSKEIFIIPDLDIVFERFMKTSYHYFISGEKKDTTIGKQFNYDTTAIKESLKNKIIDLKDNYNKNVYVVNDVKDMLDKTKFKELCKHFDLDFNLECFTAVKSIIN